MGKSNRLCEILKEEYKDYLIAEYRETHSFEPGVDIIASCGDCLNDDEILDRIRKIFDRRGEDLDAYIEEIPEIVERLSELGIPNEPLITALYERKSVHIDELKGLSSDFNLAFDGKNFQIKNPYTGKDMGEAISVIEEHNRRNPNKGLKLPNPTKKKKIGEKKNMDQNKGDSLKMK